MFRGFQRLRVYTQLALVCVVTGTLLTVFVVYSLSRASESARENLIAYADRLTTQVEQNIETNYTNYAKILRMISFDKDVQSFLLSDDEAQRVELYSALKRALIEVATLSASITDIVVEDNSGQLYNLADFLLPLPTMDLRAGSPAVSAMMSRKSLNREQRYIVMGKGVSSIDSYNQTNLFIGGIYLVLSPDAFTGDALSSDASGTALYLTDEAGQVLWSSPETASITQLRQALQNPSEVFYLADQPIENLGRYHLYTLQTESGELLAESSQQDILLAVLLLLTLLVLMWVAFARNLVRPLTRLRRFIGKVQTGTRQGLEERAELTGYHEAEVISSEFNILLQKTAELTDELIRTNSTLYESRLLAKQSELAHLRSQINPHFLYNTLETMVGIAYTKGETQLAEIARSLSLIFKFSIKGDAMVPLKTEWKIAQNYVNIQHFRFSDRFDVAFTLPPECEGISVPKLILQPLIENAVVHGIEQQDGFCHLCVSASTDGKALTLQVVDDGAGMPPETLIRLNRLLCDSGRLPQTETEAHHIGILNVDSRIKLQYGANYGISLTSEWGRGTTVTMTLPAGKEEPHV